MRCSSRLSRSKLHQWLDLRLHLHQWLALVLTEMMKATWTHIARLLDTIALRVLCHRLQWWLAPFELILHLDQIDLWFASSPSASTMCQACDCGWVGGCGGWVGCGSGGGGGCGNLLNI